MNDFDVIIVGAGIGGLITGAILAKKDRMKVLVLEKESNIGGRLISFGGPHGSYSAEEFRRNLRGSAGMWITRTEPSLEKIIEGGLFQNYILDCGLHGASAGERSRFAILANALGKQVRVSPQVGFLYYRDGEWLQMNDYTKAWPKESRQERSRVARERLLLSTEEASVYDHVDIKSYLESVTDDPYVQEYYSFLAILESGLDDVREISAGEWIKCNNMTSATGAHLVHGGGMGEVTGGWKNLANVFAQVIQENGGEIRTDAKVKEVIIKGHEAKGVWVEQNGKSSKIEAPIVISNIPMDKVFKVIPETCFPAEMCERIKKIVGFGDVFGFYCTKELLEPKYPKAYFNVRSLPGIEKMGVEKPHYFQFEQTTAVDPSKVLKGSGHITLTTMILPVKDPDEVHDKKLVNILIDAQIGFLREHYPKFDNLLEWTIFTTCERIYSIKPSPGLIGDRRISVKHPTIRNLYFTGDTVSQWDYGISGCAHGATLCAGAVTGKNYLQFFPPYMR
jgi:protoporphyrinogen oxidase